MRPFLSLALILLLVGTSCGSDEREEILVFAAASLTDVMEHLGQRFAETDGVKVSFNLGGSTALAQQIVRGAPADAFVSAGPEPMERLEIGGHLVLDSKVILLTNELVLIGARDKSDRLGIEFVEDLADADVRLAIADPDLAPAGAYAKEALENLGLWHEVEGRVVPASNVRVALGYVETGNVGVGIVYRTDSQLSDDLKVISTIPVESYAPIVYPAAVLKRSQHEGAARRFLEFLKGEHARDIFREFGFVPHVRKVACIGFRF